MRLLEEKLVKILARHGPLNLEELASMLGVNIFILRKILSRLSDEGYLREFGDKIDLTLAGRLALRPFQKYKRIVAGIDPETGSYILHKQSRDTFMEVKSKGYTPFEGWIIKGPQPKTEKPRKNLHESLNKIRKILEKGDPYSVKKALLYELNLINRLPEKHRRSFKKELLYKAKKETSRELASKIYLELVKILSQLEKESISQ